MSASDRVTNTGMDCCSFTCMDRLPAGPIDIIPTPAASPVMTLLAGDHRPTGQMKVDRGPAEARTHVRYVRTAANVFVLKRTVGTKNWRVAPLGLA